jgi:hypothetical protein
VMYYTPKKGKGIEPDLWLVDGCRSWGGRFFKCVMLVLLWMTWRNGGWKSGVGCPTTDCLNCRSTTSPCAWVGLEIGRVVSFMDGGRWISRRSSQRRAHEADRGAQPSWTPPREDAGGSGGVLEP